MRPHGTTRQKHLDSRGCLVEVLRADEISRDMKHFYFSTSRPGAIRGNHYHHRKTEWFCVVRGIGRLVLEHRDSGYREEITMAGDCPMTVEIPPGFVHAIQNVGDAEMLLLVVVDEVFDPEDPDTYYELLLGSQEDQA